MRRLVRVVHPVLQQVQRHAERRERELPVESQLFEAEEVLVQPFREVAPDERLGPVREGLRAVGTAVRERGPLWEGSIVSVEADGRE